MDLANMRENGVRFIAADCQEIGCGHEASVNVDHLPDDLPVPDVALRLRIGRRTNGRAATAAGARSCRY